MTVERKFNRRRAPDRRFSSPAGRSSRALWRTRWRLNSRTRARRPLNEQLELLGSEEELKRRQGLDEMERLHAGRRHDVQRRIPL
jgi:hypothetical protein